MKIQVCVRCKKRPASVYITRLDGGNSINEGLCFQCAAELGIKPPPVVDMLKKMKQLYSQAQEIQNESEEKVSNAYIESAKGEDLPLNNPNKKINKMKNNNIIEVNYE